MDFTGLTWSDRLKAAVLCTALPPALQAKLYEPFVDPLVELYADWDNYLLKNAKLHDPPQAWSSDDERFIRSLRCQWLELHESIKNLDDARLHPLRGQVLVQAREQDWRVPLKAFQWLGVKLASQAEGIEPFILRM